MKLYYAETMNPRKVCATAKHLGIPLEFVHVPFGPTGTRSETYRAINPNGAVPTLVHGERTLWESAAISAYLATSVRSPLWPLHDAVELGEVLRWISWDAFHWSRAVGPFYFENDIKPKFGFGTPDPDVRAKHAANVARHAPVLDAHLADHPFVANDRLSLADFCLGAMLPDWEKLDLPLESYPNIHRWFGRLLEVDAFADPWPKHAETFAA